VVSIYIHLKRVFTVSIVIETSFYFDFVNCFYIFTLILLLNDMNPLCITKKNILPAISGGGGDLSPKA
jgi:hypothetical protein